MTQIEMPRGSTKVTTLATEASRSSFSDLNESTEAMLSERLENVRITDGVRVSDTGAAMPTTNLANGGSGWSSLRDPTSSSSSTTFFRKHEASFFHENVGNRHIGEGFYFTGKMDGATTPIANSSLNRKVKLVPERQRHAGINSNLMKKKENLKDKMESLVHPAVTEQESVSKEFSAQPEYPHQYSPMDMSPYPETVVDSQHSNEAPMTSEEHLAQADGSQFSEGNTKNGNDPLVEDLAYATKQLYLGEVCINVSGTNINDSEACASEGIGEISPEDCASGTETESFKSVPDELDFNNDNSISAATKLYSPSNSESDGTKDCYSFCNTESTGGTKFTFTTSTSSQGPASVRPYKKINQRKGVDSYRSPATLNPSNAFWGGQQPEDSLQNSVNANLTGSQPKEEMKSSNSVWKEVNNGSSGTLAATSVAREACENWRLRATKLMQS